MTEITNIAAYLFAPLTDLKPLRERLLAQCKAWGLRGTILLSTEGINLFVAGQAAEIEQLLATLRAVPGLEKLTPKISLSDHQPFTRMLVRIKQEIIAFGVPGIDPSKRTSPKLAPAELKRWLDEGRAVTLLDTRNDYEVKLGTFQNAVTLDLDHFRNFPVAVAKLPAELKQQPIVMFCTGGIRCEKAGPFMEREGFENVVQLEGGILKYFEDCGGAHYDGECFVFDQRVGVDPSLAETDNTQCFNCLAPLTLDEQSDPRYVAGQSCPYCYRTSEEQLAEQLAARQAELNRLVDPLPGSQPYANQRPLHIPASSDGLTLLAALTQIFPHVEPAEWQALCAASQFLNAQEVPVLGSQIVRAGEVYLRLFPVAAEPAVNAQIRLLYEDQALVVVDKPAPLPLHPSGRFNRNTLQAMLNLVYAPQRLRPAHRLDANTTGIVVLARTKHVAGKLQPQFAAGTVRKHYLARIHGHPPVDEFVATASISVAAVDLGARAIDPAGLSARTEFTVLQRCPDGTSLVQARPITGRTNQIRIHLWDLGWPIVGDQVYLPNRQSGDTQTHDIDDAALCLHSLRIGFCHPLTGEQVSFETAAPSWASASV